MNLLENKLQTEGNRMNFDDIRNAVVHGGSLAVSVVLGAFGGGHALLSILCWMIVLDYATAIGNARYHGIPFNGKKAVQGVWKKLMYFVAILFAVQLDNLFGIPEVGLNTGGKIRIAVMVILCATEASSICKHLGACDITFPTWVKQMIQGLTKGKDTK
jgi:toxin secretion/phage lysis holin